MRPPLQNEAFPHLGKVLQHLRHLVAALAAAHVDDDVRVGVLGQRLRNHSLTAAKGAGDGRGAALHTAVLGWGTEG